MSIIIEGCDGTGKTTLTKKLIKHFPSLDMGPRFATSLDGPKDGLCRMMVDALLHDLIRSPRLYDRHSIISEYVYGSVLPNRHVHPDFLGPYMQSVRERIANHSLIVWCEPPLPIVRQAVAQEEQMDGVVQHLDRLYEAYQVQRVMWLGRSVTFDFTRPIEFNEVCMYVQDHIKKMENIEL